MQLLSDTVSIKGRLGPVNPPVYDKTCAVDLNKTTTFQNGPPLLALGELRQDAPVSWQSQGADGEGFWAITGYENVMRVNGDPETFSSQAGGILMSEPGAQGRHPLLGPASVNAMINMDAPWHMQLRMKHMPYFTPKYLAGLKDKVRAEIDRLLDVMGPLGSCDIVPYFSSRLPLFTLCEILGVPEEDREKFLGWMHYLEMAQNLSEEREAQGELTITPELMAFVQAFNENVSEMFEYGRRMLHERRQNPKEDLMTAIAMATLEGEQLPDEYLDGSWLLIVFAGNDTTRNSISATIKLLTDFPEEKARLIADPALIPNAINELLRMISPVIYMRRTATRDVEVGGQMIAEGEKVVLYYGSANRDPAMFENPDVLDVTRANAVKHVAFGYGPHVCLGKRVAQLQLEAVLEKLLIRFPDLAYAGGIQIAPQNLVYAIRSLPVTFTPEKAA